MSATDALLFIDANKYLDLYRIDKGRKLLASLAEQASYIFVTQQIVDEVQRNKLNVASEFLRKKRQDMKFHGINVPDHFSGSTTGKNQEILSEMSKISKSVNTINDEIDAHTLEIMTQVANSNDEVSKELGSVFSKVISATPDELKRARQRKEVGNPPGKRNDPLGDEITWEQIISHFEGKRRLWIISRDGDYGTAFGGKLFINGLLKSDLMKVTKDPVVYLFNDLIKGLMHFVETTKVKAELKLTPEEAEEIEAEEQSLPPVDSSLYVSQRSSADLQKTIKDMQLAIMPSADFQKTIKGMQLAMPSSDLQKIIKDMQHAMPSADLQKTIKDMQLAMPSADLQKTIKDMQLALMPLADLQKSIKGLSLQSKAYSPSKIPKDEDK